MTEKEYTPKSRSYLACDGCGYSIGWGDERVAVRVASRDTQGYMRTDELHFHLDPPDAARDCLGYWWKGRATRARLAK